ncbi:MAG: MATE family efflux transporter [Bacilli bacterium]|nr:MATE family efflux transporter [Bacilli bacterium]
MKDKILFSIKRIDYRLFFALLVMGICPTIYTTLRTFYLGQLPGDYAFSIAGQLTWVNLIYEIINEAIILPLYFFMGQAKNDKQEFTNRVKNGLIIALISYLILTIFICVFAEPLLNLMATSKDIIKESISYIRFESIANIFTILFSFNLVVLITIGKDRYVYLLTIIKLIFSVILDTFLISSFNFSLNLGVNGIAISNIIINAILFVVSIIILKNEQVKIFDKQSINFDWLKDFFKVGSISGIESLVRNLFYLIMIVRMVNVVSEQGTYWVANNFIWGYLLLPIIQLGEIIKKDVASNSDNMNKNMYGYMFLTIIICLFWFILLPLYKPFMYYVLQFEEVDKLFHLVILLMIFYVSYAFQNICDSIFYGLGKTQYMLFESIVTNVVYYGICFILYLNKIFIPSLTGIALMFGIGILFDAIVSYLSYIYLKRKLNSI